jgi:hypothetical protein
VTSIFAAKTLRRWALTSLPLRVSDGPFQERGWTKEWSNRDLSVGTRLVADYKKQCYVCTVEAGDKAKLAFLVGDKRYTSPRPPARR